MTEQKIMMEEDNGNTNLTDIMTVESEAGSRKERRKASKMEKRKKKRKELAEMARREAEARLNDPEEQRRLLAEEEQERMRAEEDRRRFEEMERKILEAWERKKALEEKEEDERRRRAEEEEIQSKQNQVEHENGMDDDGWEYVEEGPPEIIWQGNEIIVKKNKVRVKKKDTDEQIMKEDPNRPTSNPLPPQSDAFVDHKNASNLSAQQLLETVAQETPNFGTEQDKAHCPFHLKTGACRFGTRCSRIHFYPDKSCTLLIKNMYNGPGLAWEQDEGLEYTDEEVEHAYEEFYEDVHTEFLKFGEIVNFKVCRNGSSHLKGNVYVHYQSLDSAVQSYKSVNGRYFAGKQVQCEFVGVTRWRVAICGEFMKSKLKRCSRGTACNFIHCFRNPGGDYEWADWDKPAPRYWVKEMAALFGYPEESRHDRKTELGSPGLHSHRYYSVQSESRKIESSSSSRNYSDDDLQSSEPRGHHRRSGRKHTKKLGHEQYLDTSNSTVKQPSESASNNHDTERYWLDKDRVGQRYSSNLSPSGRKRKSESRGGRTDETNIHKTEYDRDTCHYEGSRSSRRHREKYDCRAGSKGEERIEDDKYTAKGPRQQKKTSTSPADKCNSTNETALTGDCSDGSPRSDGSEEFEDGNKLKNSSIWDHSNTKSPRDSHLRYQTCDYSSKYYGRKDRRRAERGTSDHRGSDVRFDERGRWEPDKEV